MPKDDFTAAPIVLTFFTQGFGEVNYSIPINNPYDVTPSLTAFELEARAKGCAVMIQVSLVPLEELYGDLLEESEGDSEDE